MDGQQEPTISRKRALYEFFNDLYYKKRRRLGEKKHDQEIIWEILTHNPYIHQFPYISWSNTSHVRYPLLDQLIDFYGLFRVLGQCKIFRGGFLFEYSTHFQQLFNENRILNLYYRRKTFFYNQKLKVGYFYILRDVVYALKIIILKQMHRTFADKKTAIQMLEL